MSKLLPFFLIGCLAYACNENKKDDEAMRADSVSHINSKLTSNSTIDSLTVIRVTILRDTATAEKIELVDQDKQKCYLWFEGKKPILLAMPEPPNDEGVDTRQYHYFFFDNSGKVFMAWDTSLNSQVFFGRDRIQEIVKNQVYKSEVLFGTNSSEFTSNAVRNYKNWSLRVLYSLRNAPMKLKYSFWDYPPEFTCDVTESTKAYRQPQQKSETIDLAAGARIEYVGPISDSLDLSNNGKWIEIWIRTPSEPTDDESWYILSSDFFKSVNCN